MKKREENTSDAAPNYAAWQVVALLLLVGAVILCQILS